ncbi:DUF5986 family protein [Metabacillus sp. YM-086]|uniref:DUF5986 family protein n=1 Tax=Metabacillus sp. YM-086 TaxID=3341729 RepID=UPI003A8A957C
MTSGINQSVIGDLVRAFTETTNDVVNEIKQEYGLDTGNFKNGGAWDIRFRRIKQIALENNLIVLTKRRGIWSFVCVLNENTGDLYVFTKEKNLEIVIKNLGKRKIHYFHAFISLNSGPVELDNHQMALFSTLPEDYETKRIREAQKILGEEYPLVNQVIFIVAQEEERKMVGVEAKLYNRFFELLDVENWSSFVPEDQYGNILVLDEEVVDNTESVTIIPKVKQSIKERKNHFENEIATKKQEKEDLIEEENS